MAFALTKEYLPRYTYADFCKWEGRWELIDGVPYSMSPLPSGKHQWVSLELAKQFMEELNDCSKCNVSMPMDWKIGNNTVLEPDLFVACFDFKSKKYITEAPIIVVEVLSPSNRLKDIHVKFQIYLEQGVKYYIVINPKDETYIIYELSGNEYQIAKKGHDGSFKFDIDNDCHPEIDFGKIW